MTEKEYQKAYREKHREEINEKMKVWRRKYRKTIYGRALDLLMTYNYNDKKTGRGKGDLTPEWIIENIFSKPCAHCGKTGWQVIGCNRIDNDKPHTMDNVEPCCFECNAKLGGNYLKGKLGKTIDQISPVDGEVINTWISTREAGRNGFTRTDILSVCQGRQKHHKGYIWKRHM